ncbi:hypothetical protein ACJMK2_040612, partial [Sinanodonta woodiana]
VKRARLDREVDTTENTTSSGVLDIRSLSPGSTNHLDNNKDNSTGQPSVLDSTTADLTTNGSTDSGLDTLVSTNASTVLSSSDSWVISGVPSPEIGDPNKTLTEFQNSQNFVINFSNSASVETTYQHLLSTPTTTSVSAIGTSDNSSSSSSDNSPTTTITMQAYMGNQNAASFQAFYPNPSAQNPYAMPAYPVQD